MRIEDQTDDTEAAFYERTVWERYNLEHAWERIQISVGKTRAVTYVGDMEVYEEIIIE
jgi:hypothetical protein